MNFLPLIRTSGNTFQRLKDSSFKSPIELPGGFRGSWRARELGTGEWSVDRWDVGTQRKIRWGIYCNEQAARDALTTITLPTA